MVCHCSRQHIKGVNAKVFYLLLYLITFRILFTLTIVLNM